jgi:hypothetical protein
LSQTNPKALLKLFSLIILSVVFIYNVSYAGEYSYEKIFGEKKLPVGSTVGSVEVGDLKANQAYNKVSQAVAKWESETVILLKYEDIEIEIEKGIFGFNIEESVKSGFESAHVPLNTVVSSESMLLMLAPFLNTPIFQAINIESLQMHLTEIASSLKVGEHILHLTEFLNEEEVTAEAAAESAVSYPTNGQTLSKWINLLNNMEIKPGETLSLLTVMKKYEIEPVPSESLTVFASGIYKAVLSTNFEVIERHTSRNLPAYIELGFEVSIEDGEQDFVFKNPNSFSYRFHFILKDNKLYVEIVGVPFTTGYEVEVISRTFQPKTVIQYNAALSIDTKNVVNEGKTGYLAEVYRIEIIPETNEQKRVKIAEDFYPPVHRIEERGWPKESTDPTNELSEQSQNVEEINQQKQDENAEIIQNEIAQNPLEESDVKSESDLNEPSEQTNEAFNNQSDEVIIK